MTLSRSQVASFQKVVWSYFVMHGRNGLPWRQPEADGNFDPYKILVSELMLQQTQVKRVIPKYHEFLQQFPSAERLAQASLSDVLIAWQGLGYNRRAKFLWQAARMISEDMGGKFPESLELLTSLPGVGKNTAGAVINYTFDYPVVFVETNIRSVYIHHFFHDKQEGITDKEILELVGQTLPQNKTRQWFWAVMDYGAHLKQTVGNVSQASKTYVKQSPLKGSRREIRGKILRLLATGAQELNELEKVIADARLVSVLDDLEREEMIERRATCFRLSQ